jgi:Ser/Thr protein kinase RdoA (MazF antagonist)
MRTVSEGDDRREDPERSMRTVSDERPVLRIVRGEPTDDETAALVAVVAALARRSTAAVAPPRSQWRNRARNIRPAIGPGPGAWRASGLPR